MASYALRRVLQGALVVLGVAFIVFMLMHLAPGDPAAMMLHDGASPQEVAALRTRLGLDRTLHVQFGAFVAGAVRGDLGRSLYHERPAIQVVLHFLPATFTLAFAALGLALVIAVPLGILSALRRDTIWDYLGMGLAVLGQAMPPFWLGIVLIFVFSVELRWFPTSGTGTFRHLILPAVTLSAYLTALLTRLVRSSLLEVLDQDFVRTAHSKGLPRRVVVVKHALRTTLIPLVTIIGIQLGDLLAGALVVETVFAWPGVGRLLIQAIGSRDFPVVQAGVLVISVVVVVLNIAVDLLYAYLDPRISYA